MRPGTGGIIRAHPPLVLVAEDDRRMRGYLRATLLGHGFRVLEAVSGEEALTHAAGYNPELILLDLGLPDIDGLEVLRRLREWAKAPILILSARSGENGIVAALDCGANDYLTKPFGTAELLARIRVWLRHAERVVGSREATITIGDWRIDFARRLIFVAGRQVELTATQYKLVGVMMRNAGKVLTHSQILTAVWGPTYTREMQYLRVYMGQLRHRLERDPTKPAYLMTETGIGYRLRDPSIETRAEPDLARETSAAE